MDNAKISKLVEELPICKDGKAKVTDILKELGYTPPARTPSPGEVWRNLNSGYVLILDDDRYHYFWSNSAPSKNHGATSYCRDEKWEYVAPSIEDAIKVMNGTKKK